MIELYLDMMVILILIILIVRIVSVNIYLHFIFVLRVIKCVITAYVEGIKIVSVYCVHANLVAKDTPVTLTYLYYTFASGQS